MELVKNNRFKRGGMVDIYHSPIYEGYTTEITDVSVGNSWKINVHLDKDISSEMVSVRNIIAFGFGVGVIDLIKYVDSNRTLLKVSFPKSMFPKDDIMKYVGSTYQTVLIFHHSLNIQKNYVVSHLKETVAQASYGYEKSIYNLQTKTELYLAPVMKIDNGNLTSILYSKGIVLKSCNDDDYTPTISGWDGNFPLELSGTSIDPIYRRAYLKKREINTSSNKSKMKLEFILIG